MGTIPKASLSPPEPGGGDRWGLYLKLHCHHQNQEVGRDGDSIPKASLSPPDPGGGERWDSIPKASLSPPDPGGGVRWGVYT